MLYLIYYLFPKRLVEVSLSRLHSPLQQLSRIAMTKVSCMSPRTSLIHYRQRLDLRSSMSLRKKILLRRLGSTGSILWRGCLDLTVPANHLGVDTGQEGSFRWNALWSQAATTA